MGGNKFIFHAPEIATTTPAPNPLPAPVTTTPAVEAPAGTPVRPPTPSERSPEPVDEAELAQVAERVRRITFREGSMGIFWKGASVFKVKPGSQADELGVQPGWLVVTVNGRMVDHTNTVRAVKAAVAADPNEVMIVFDTNPEVPDTPMENAASPKSPKKKEIKIPKPAKANPIVPDGVFESI